MEEKKAPPVEKSLNYIAWDIKTLVKQVERALQILEAKFGIKNDDSHF